MSNTSKETNRRYYIKHRDEILEQQRKYRLDHRGKYNLEHRDKISKYTKKYYSEHRNYFLESQRKYYLEHKDEYSNYNKAYYLDHKIENKDKVRKRFQKWYRERYNTDIGFNLRCKISISIGAALKGNKAGRHWEDLVGYTLTQLKDHLQKTLPKGYTWKEYIKGKLQLDHIIPLSFFKYTKSEDTEFKKCWSLDNLQLLTKEENQQKGKKLNYETQQI